MVMIHLFFLFYTVVCTSLQEVTTIRPALDSVRLIWMIPAATFVKHGEGGGIEG